MDDNKLLIPVDGTALPALGDALLRLRVLFPAYAFRVEGNQVEISGVPPELEADVVQTTSDQILRSAFDVNSAELRRCLYARLLG